MSTSWGKTLMIGGLFWAMGIPLLIAQPTDSSTEWLNRLEAYRDSALTLVAYEGRPFRAIAYMDSSWQELSPPQDSAQFDRAGNFFLLQGYVYYRYELFTSALNSYQKAYGYYQKVPHRTTTIAGDLFGQMGNAYTRLGDYEQAEDMLSYGLEICLLNGDEDEAGLFYADLAIVYLERENYAQAQTACMQGLELKGTTSYGQGLLHSNLGNCFLAQQNLNRAEQTGIQHLNRALSLLEQPDKTSHPHNTGDIHRALGDAYFRQSRIEKALMEYDKALADFFFAGEGQATREKGKTYTSLGSLYLSQGEVETALSHFQLALQEVIPDFHPNSLLTNPSSGEQFAENTIMEALSGKARALEAHFLKNQDHAYLEAALECHDLILQVEDTLQSHYAYTPSKWILSKARHQEIEQVIRMCMNHWEASGDSSYLIRAFRYSEKGKAAVFRESLLLSEQMGRIGPQDSLIRQIQSTYSQLVEWAIIMDLDTLNELGIMAKKIDIEHQRKQLSLQLAATYPEYFQVKYHTSPVGILPLQDQLKARSQTLIQYFIGEENAYVFVVSAQGLEGYRLDPNFNFALKAAAYRQLILNLRSSASVDLKSAAQDFATASHELYKALLGPVEHHLTSAEGRLVIIPDGPLFLFPFASLLTDLPTSISSFRDLPYFLRPMVGAYSATVYYRQCIQEIPPAEIPLLGVAPHTISFANEPIIKGSASLIENLQQDWGGKTLLGSEATLPTFELIAPEAAVLFLHTHGHAFSNPDQTQDSYLQFFTPSDSGSTQGKLTLKYLYSRRLNLKAQLAILSACESGFGNTPPGEPMVGMGEGFFLSGCPSLLTTGWNVNAHYHKLLMEAVMANLLAGESKDVALFHAQQSFLESPQAINSAYAPHNWLASSLYGNPDPLVLDTKKWKFWWLLLIGIPVLGIGGGLFWIKRKQKASA